MANIERTPSTADAVPNPTANANERATAESQKTPCGAARRAAERVVFATGIQTGEIIDAEFRPLIEAARKRLAPGHSDTCSYQLVIGCACDCGFVALRDALRTIEEDA